MKLNHLNLGKSLSRSELKEVKGGTPICNVGSFIKCFCGDGTFQCDFGDGKTATAVICMRDNACAGRGGYTAGSTCYTSCP
jgi:hypothetical protein